MQHRILFTMGELTAKKPFYLKNPAVEELL